MQYWNSVLNEVLNKNDHECAFFEFENYASIHVEKNNTKEPRELRIYYLDQYPGVHLTKREAECMFWMMQDRTIADTALKMSLSPRTVEFYVKNMKLKLQCATKKALIEKVLQTNLLQQLEKEGMRIVRH